MSKSYKVYFAGELFSLKHLMGNAFLANHIHQVSKNKYLCTLPQALEQRDTTPKSIRDQDISEVIKSDLAIFNFDGESVDTGTVVELMLAKFLDIPSVIIRTDFRAGGDSKIEPWNLMMSFYPRTEVIVIDSIAEYQSALSGMAFQPDPISVARYSMIGSESVSKNLANRITSAFDRLLKTKPLMSKRNRKEMEKWVVKACGMDLTLKKETVMGWIAKKGEALLG